ncbi:hypothetical protein ElyMa_003037000 [Elysia marginata]|uniref:Uncharacterized protein n=1 Tax=Elysia marginata TaxID=1093978 RepID=A0AAV4IJN9_9GAST|nr:hypothetical protein ElyMa_003037000 [Elysia marginata]
MFYIKVYSSHMRQASAETGALQNRFNDAIKTRGLLQLSLTQTVFVISAERVLHAEHEAFLLVLAASNIKVQVIDAKINHSRFNEPMKNGKVGLVGLNTN